MRICGANGIGKFNVQSHSTITFHTTLKNDVSSKENSWLMTKKSRRAEPHLEAYLKKITSISRHMGPKTKQMSSGSAMTATATFTVRKISDGIGVERLFPIHSPNIESIVLNKVGRVRRAKLYFLRERSGKSARIKEKRMAVAAKK